ncbi:response regulator [Nonlabens agnitus]|uniref:DNA-binding response regulator n=1 Tax=Nonlabens agnitus TaxID=870484 RepID=A0A2S9WQ97_9FLAO|nr:response regulator transcription factor [Nonlabens agnitus]PRP65664.1 DNA-binding response regulator [Nonlabens agnitus]
MKIRYAIVDDNSFLIHATKEKLSFFDDFDLRFTAIHGKDVLEKLEKHSHIDLILMDIEMPVMNGVEATALVKSRYPHIKIIILTVFDNDDHIFNAIQAGADGYLLKEVDPESLKNGILETLDGGAAMTPSIAMKTLRLLRNPKSIEYKDDKEYDLSTRETEVLEQLAQGLSYTKIADNLILSPSTVRKHIENIYKKLQVHSKMEAVEKARNNNLI